jgi:lysozyme family protein
MTFDRAFDMVIGQEGGYVDDKADPGGETNFGISKRAYPNLDIKALTLAKAKEIYFRDYWVPADCGYIVDEPMAILVFDCAVNQGVSRAKQIAAKAKTPVEFQAERALHYASLPTFQHFGRGWMRRLFDGLLKSGAKV